jgi:hypothetical protein
MKIKIILAILAVFALSPMAQAVSPAPDGGYPGGNTAEGQAALLSLTTGGFNTAVGFLPLRSNTEGQFNTAIGAGALLANVGDPSMFDGVENTATGAGALLSNTIGRQNTANGAFALAGNTTGDVNTATGFEALLSNTEGYYNTANGSEALLSNTTGTFNTAIGASALLSNTTGSSNTATGGFALYRNATGVDNTATGNGSLYNNTIGSGNTAMGGSALSANTTGANNTAIGASTLSNNYAGSNNIAVGYGAGANVTAGGYNVYIGAGVPGVANDVGHTYISNISSTVQPPGGNIEYVTINLDTKLLGHSSSSRRYKQDIEPMTNVSEALYQLKPVTYRYKKEIDQHQSAAFGLIAEEVAKVNPDLVAHDAKGRPESVHYEMVNAMLLNEFLKEHRRGEGQQSKIDQQQATISELKSTVARQRKDFDAIVTEQQRGFQATLAKQEEQIRALQKVSDQLELSKPAPQVVANK